MLGIIVSTLVLNALLSFSVSRRTRAQVDGITNNAFASVRLLDRIALDMSKMRSLVLEHVFETDARTMQRIEQNIADLRADYDAAARDYAPLATYPGEAFAWHKLQADVERAQPQIARVLSLSIDNADLKAFAELHAAERLLDAVDDDVNAVVTINDDQAHRAAAAVEQAEARSMVFRGILWLVGLVVTLGLGTWAMRLISRAERRERDLYHMEERNRELDAFASRVAHDLQNPLTTIRLALAVKDKLGAESTAIIGRGVIRMSALIEDLLQLSRIQTSAGEDICDPAVARDIQDTVAEQLVNAGGEMQVVIDSASIRCSEGLFRQIVSNLVQNAIKYRRQGAGLRIEVVGRVVGDQYEVRVSDNGIGMSPEEAQQAFAPLYRAQRAHDVTGTGLGLSIVSRIVDAYGGSVRIESELDHGTTFIVQLPRRSDVDPAGTKFTPTLTKK